MGSIKDIVFEKISMVKTKIENEGKEHIQPGIKTLQFIHSTLISGIFDEERVIIENTISDLQNLKKSI